MADTSTEVALPEAGAHTSELARHPEQLPMLPGEIRPHPTPRQYVLIAVVLVVITAVEISVSYLGDNINSNLIIAVLLVLAAVKFFLVAAWYMHLRTDKRLFTRFFTVGLIAAGTLYFVVLTSLTVFSSFKR